MEASSDQSSPGDQQVNRREFLNYIWGASMALLLAETGGGIAWYLSATGRPRKETLISVDPTELRAAGNAPVRYAPRLWLCHTPAGLYAFDDYCTHLGCTIKWVPTNQRFECPCHGAKFLLDGTCIGGPARRNLDSCRVIAHTPQGTFTTPDQGGPVKVDMNFDVAIEVDVLVRFVGKPRL